MMLTEKKTETPYLFLLEGTYYWIMYESKMVNTFFFLKGNPPVH